MPGTGQIKKHELECLRLAADCRNMAGAASSRAQMDHFLHMASMWEEMAASRFVGEPGGRAAQGIFELLVPGRGETAPRRKHDKLRE